ncbi:hypothetical protein D3C77_641160 [compost metagenome]
MRRYDQLVTPALEQVQYATPCGLDTCSLGRQHLFDAIWQQPAVYRCHFANHLSIRQA